VNQVGREPKDCRGLKDHRDQLAKLDQLEQLGKLVNSKNIFLKSIFLLGQRGAPGQPGERGICPKYCALDGGVFFEDGTRRKRK